MGARRIGSAIVVCGVLLLAGVAGADDVPGTVVIDDENGSGEDIAFTAPAGPVDLGQDENAFVAKLREGDCRAQAVAVDVLPNAVVATRLEIFQPTGTKHRGKTGSLKQQSHVRASFVVFDDLVNLNVIGDGSALAPACKGQGTITDADGDGNQDGAKWLFQCAEGALDAALLDISGSDAATAQSAVQSLLVGKVRVAGKTASPPTLATDVVDDVLED